MNILLYTKDEKYGEKLLTAFCKMDQGKNAISLITKEEMLVDWCQKADIIVSDQIEVADMAGEWIWLSDQCEDKYCRYRRASKIYEAVLGETVAAERRDARWIGVFGVDGVSCDQASGELVELMAQRGKTVYLNLTSLPCLLTEEYQQGDKGLSDLLFGENLVTTSFEWKGARAVYPFEHYMDLLDLRGDEIEKLLRRLKEDEQVEYVIVSMSQLWEGMLDVMMCLDQVHVVGRDNALNHIKMGVFRRYCKMENKEGLLGKLVTTYER